MRGRPHGAQHGSMYDAIWLVKGRKNNGHRRNFEAAGPTG